MNAIAVILYEDKRGPEKEFGLHALVLSCVADAMGVNMFTLKDKLDGRPMNGVTNVLQSCRSDVRRLGTRGQKVFAVIDDDRIRQHVPGVDPRTSEDAVIRAIKSSSDAPAQLEVFLLKKNTETVIEAAKHCDDGLPDAAVQQALRKNMAQRDRILNNVARAGNRAIRDCILDRVPVLGKLVEALLALVRAVPT